MKNIQPNTILVIFINCILAFDLMANESKEAHFKKELVAMEKMKTPMEQVLWGINLSLEKFSKYQSRPKEVFFNVPTSDLGIRAGSDPSLIKDPVKRKEYEKRVNENQKNIKLLNDSEVAKKQAYFLLDKIDNIAKMKLNETDRKHILPTIDTIRNLFQQ